MSCIAENSDFPSAGGIEYEERLLPDGSRQLIRIGRQLGVQCRSIPHGWVPEPDETDWSDFDTYKSSYVEQLEQFAQFVVAMYPNEALGRKAQRALACR